MYWRSRKISLKRAKPRFNTGFKSLTKEIRESKRCVGHIKKHRAYHSWQLVFRNPADFTREIRWISPLKSGGFHLLNLADFTQISPVKSTQNYKSKCFSKNSSVWWMQGGGFHPWNLADFTLKSGGFHPDFTCEIHQNYKSKCFSKNSSVWWMQGEGYDQGFHEIHQISSWNPVDFTQISPVKSTQNYKSKCFSKNSSVWWMQGGGYDQGFHEIHQISSWNLVDFTCEIHPKL